MPITHSKVSTKADSADTTLVRPVDWNANHAISAGTITDVEVAAANKDGAVGTASMRTLGTGASQAAAGDHTTPAASVSAAGHVTAQDKRALTHADDGAFTGAVAVDFTTGGNFREGETTGNVTGFTLTLPTGIPCYLLVKYGGAHTIAWTTTIKWTSQTTPTATSLVGRYDMFVFVKNVDGDVIGAADLGH